MRAGVDDLMQGFRYHVTSVNTVGVDPLAFIRPGEFEGAGQAGFNNVTVPEISQEASEYREGTSRWTQKYPGPATVSECTLQRGIAKRDLAFYDWIMGCINGTEYRADVTIWHYHRMEMGMAAQSEISDIVRHIVLHNAFPIRVKPGGDMDATAGEVSLAEVDIALESFEVKLT